jgi:putative hemolysin
VFLVLASSVASSACGRCLQDATGAAAGPWQTVITTAVMWPLVLIFAQIIPMGLFRQHADALSLVAARPLQAASTVLRPLVEVARLLSEGVSRLLGRRRTRSVHVSREELRLIIREEAGRVAPVAREMLTEALRLRERRVADVMTPRDRVVRVHRNAGVDRAAALMQRSGRSRLVVAADDAFCGWLTAWDVATAPPDAAAGDLMQELRRVSADEPLVRALRHLLADGEEMVAATDAGGKIIGVVAFEDIIAELAGEVADGR